MPLSELDSLVNKRVSLSWNGQRLSFDLSHALFSSYDIDAGTKLLLKHIACEKAVLGASSFLDAGSGTGVIGACLAKVRPDARIVLRDRDLLACAFSKRNLRLNGIMPGKPELGSSVSVLPGLLGEDDPLGPYDVVVSNIPAKAGAPVLAHFFIHAQERLLRPGGRLACVIVNTLADHASLWAKAAGLVQEKAFRGSGHTVFFFTKSLEARVLHAESLDASTASEIPRSYRRSEGPRGLGRYMVSARGYWGLPEFDTNAYSTDLAIEAMERACVGCLVRDFLILEPGIGLAALWAGRALGPLIVRGRTRDWLANRAIQENLKASFPGIRYAAENSAESTEYAIPPHDLSDALLVFPDMVPESEGVQPIWKLVLDRAKRGASVVIVAASGVTSRFDRIKPKGLVRMGEKRKKGLCALMLRRE